MEKMIIDVLVCTNRRMNKPACAAHDSQELIDWLRVQLQPYAGRLRVSSTTCMGFCLKGPNVRLAPGGSFFHQFSKQQLPQLINEVEKMLAQDSHSIF